MARFAVAQRDEMDEVNDGRCPFYPVRHHFGITTFGINAMVAHADGDRLINEHDESPDEPESGDELYAVIDGHARFEVDGDTIDGPAGTFVLVPMGVKRTAFAHEAGTTVLAIGAGRSGEAYRLTGWESFVPLMPLFESGDYEEGVRRARELVADDPPYSVVYYNLACFESRAGETEPALTHLRRSIELSPRLANLAREDEDLGALHDLPGWAELIASDGSDAESQTESDPAQTADGGGVRSVQLDDLDPVNDGKLSDGRCPFRPLRHHLGITTFGINAFTAVSAGDRILNEHDEDPDDEDGAADELYVVMRGHARFEIDGETVDAPTGTYVHVSPGAKRTAFAEEDTTIVLALGAGKPGEPYSSTGWDSFVTLLTLMNAGRYEDALPIARQLAADHEAYGVVHYNLACCESRLGQRDAAFDHLRRAVEIDAKFADLAREDEDLAAVRELPGFAAIIEG